MGERLAPVTYTYPQLLLIKDLLHQIKVYPHLQKDIGLGKRDMRVVEAALERSTRALQKRAEREQRAQDRRYGPQPTILPKRRPIILLGNK